MEIKDKLIYETGFSDELAEAYIRAKGKCEYCGTDLLFSRIGYAIAEIDHILPKKFYPHLEHEQDNLALSCHICNGIKKDYDVTKESSIESEPISDNREVIITALRQYIGQQMINYNITWKKATEILHDTWWK